MDFPVVMGHSLWDAAFVTWLTIIASVHQMRESDRVISLQRWLCSGYLCISGMSDNWLQGKGLHYKNNQRKTEKVKIILVSWCHSQAWIALLCDYAALQCFTWNIMCSAVLSHEQIFWRHNDGICMVGYHIFLSNNTSLCLWVFRELTLWDDIF